MAEASQQPAQSDVTFRYTFKFADGKETVLAVSLGEQTLEMTRPAPSGSKRMGLDFCPCDSCPRKSADTPTCPAAASLEDVLRAFAGRKSDEPVDISIETQERTYRKRTSLQEGVTSLIGIYMVTSGCEILGKLRPMVRYHLPFATLEETQYRVISMYLLAQYFRNRNGKPADWKLQNLVQMYKDIQWVNKHALARLSHGETADSGLNALVVLDALSYAIAFSIDRNMLDELELLFKAHLGQAA